MLFGRGSPLAAEKCVCFATDNELAAASYGSNDRLGEAQLQGSVSRLSINIKSTNPFNRFEGDSPRSQAGVLSSHQDGTDHQRGQWPGAVKLIKEDQSCRSSTRASPCIFHSLRNNNANAEVDGRSTF